SMPERGVGIDDGRMGQTNQPGEPGPEEPTRPSHKSQGQEDRNARYGNRSLPFSPKCVSHMPSIQLSDRDEVERCDEQSEPGGKPDRMEHHVVPIGNRTDDRPRCKLEQQRFTEAQSKGTFA